MHFCYSIKCLVFAHMCFWIFVFVFVHTFLMFDFYNVSMLTVQNGSNILTARKFAVAASFQCATGTGCQQNWLRAPSRRLGMFWLRVVHATQPTTRPTTRTSVVAISYNPYNPHKE